jgi:hypothetical protein
VEASPGWQIKRFFTPRTGNFQRFGFLPEPKGEVSSGGPWLGAPVCVGGIHITVAIFPEIAEVAIWSI